MEVVGVSLGRKPAAAAPSRAPHRVGKRYLIRTLGCQMNEHDSERLAGLLAADGMLPASSMADADLVLFNTCCIRENADNRLYGNLGHLVPWKKARPGAVIAVGGCLAQKDRERILERAPHVDVVFGTHNLHHLPELLDRAEHEGAVCEILEEAELFPSALPVRRDVAHAAWVTIQIGCDNSCTFCIVPHVRGKEISRRPGEIVDEVRRLVADGVVEVTLLGQNVNSYGRDIHGRRPLFADLLRRLGEVDGLRRLRFTSPHPKDLRPETVAAMVEVPAVCEHLHLPAQSGSDRVLARMHRGYTAERYLRKLGMAKDAIPGLAVTTDVIVGFPGETEADFEATLALVDAARFDAAYMFQYSPRPHTPAATMPDHVPPDVVAERFGRLVDVQQAMSLARNREDEGRLAEVLVEGPSRKDPAVLTGRTRTNKLAHVPAQADPGDFLTVRLRRAAAHHFEADLVGAPG